MAPPDLPDHDPTESDPTAQRRSGEDAIDASDESLDGRSPAPAPAPAPEPPDHGPAESDPGAFRDPAAGPIDASSGGDGAPSSTPDLSDPGLQVRAILANVGSQLKQLRTLQHDTDAQLLALADREEALDDRARALEAQQEELSRRRESLAAIESAAAEDKAALRRVEDERAALRVEREAMEAECVAWKSRQDEVEAAGAEMLDELERRERAVAEREAQAAERATAIAGERQTLDEAIDALAAERASWLDEQTARQAEHDERAEEVASRERHVVHLDQRAQAELETLRGEVEEMSRRLAERTSEWEAAVAQSEQLARRGAELEERLDEARRAGAEAGEGAVEDAESLAATAAVLETMRLERDEAQSQVEAMKASLDSTHRELEAMRAQVAAAKNDRAEHPRGSEDGHKRIEELERQLQELHDERRRRAEDQAGRDGALQQRIRELEAQAESSASPGEAEAEAVLADLRAKAERIAEVASHLKRRQRRLRVLRKALKAGGRAPAVPAAPAAPSMDHHATQMRRLDALRQEVTDERSRMIRAEQKMIRRWARPRAVATVGWMLVIAVVCAVAVWFGVDRFRPAVVTASVTLEPKGRHRGPLPDEEAMKWQAWHVELVGDPAFRERLAGRMEDRKIERYADVAALSGLLDNDLTMDLSQPTEVTMTLEGTRAAELTEVLDLLATTVATESTNAIRNRPGGAWAAVRGEREERGRLCYSSIDPVPIEDRRLLYAGPAFAVVYLVVLGIVGLVYRHLLGVKREFGDGDDPLGAPAAN